MTSAVCIATAASRVVAVRACGCDNITRRPTGLHDRRRRRVGSGRRCQTADGNDSPLRLPLRSLPGSSWISLDFPMRDYLESPDNHPVHGAVTLADRGPSVRDGPAGRRSDSVGGDEDVLEGAVLVGVDERVLDSRDQRGRCPQLPVGQGGGSEVDDGLRHQAVVGHGAQVLPA